MKVAANSENSIVQILASIVQEDRGSNEEVDKRIQAGCSSWGGGVNRRLVRHKGRYHCM